MEWPTLCSVIVCGLFWESGCAKSAPQEHALFVPISIYDNAACCLQPAQPYQHMPRWQAAKTAARPSPHGRAAAAAVCCRPRPQPPAGPRPPWKRRAGWLWSHGLSQPSDPPVSTSNAASATTGVDRTASVPHPPTPTFRAVERRPAFHLAPVSGWINGACQQSQPASVFGSWAGQHVFLAAVHKNQTARWHQHLVWALNLDVCRCPALSVRRHQPNLQTQTVSSAAGKNGLARIIASIEPQTQPHVLLSSLAPKQLLALRLRLC